MVVAEKIKTIALLTAAATEPTRSSSKWWYDKYSMTAAGTPGRATENISLDQKSFLLIKRRRIRDEMMSENISLDQKSFLLIDRRRIWDIFLVTYQPYVTVSELIVMAVVFYH